MSKTTGLISCQALLEGADVPPATVCLWGRPTKSGLLYTQGTGRVLRPFPAPAQVPGNRPYQTECLQAIRQASMEGCNRQLIVLPTGGGKTHVFSQLPQFMNLRRPDQMLVLVQADELAFQAADKLRIENPRLKIGLEKAQYKSTWSDDIIVASVQTIGGTKAGEAPGTWEWSKRLKTLDPSRIVKVVVDESHHITANNYHGILRYFGVMKSDPAYNDPAKFLLGVTATPNRSDNKGLEGFFDKIVYSRDIRTMIREGWLANPVGHRVETMVSLDGVATRGGDYAKGELETRINTPERNKLIVDKYLELGEGAPFIALTVDVQHTIDLTNTFRARGIETFGIASRSDPSCEWLVSKEEDRRTVIDKFKADWVGFVKKNAIILDFVDNVSGVGQALVTAPTLMGLRADFNARGKSLVEAVEEIEKIKAAKPGINAALFSDLNSLRAMSEKIDLFAVPTVPPEVQQASQFSWTTGISEGTYQLSLPDRGMLTIKVTALGEFEISKHVTGVKTPLGAAKTLAEALKLADKSVPQEAQVMLRSDAAWRSLPASDAQVGLLRRLYPELRRPFTNDSEFDKMVRNQYSRGQISAMISQRGDKIPKRR